MMLSESSKFENTTSGFAYVTTDVAKFECGTVINVSTDKLAVVCRDVNRWNSLAEEWLAHVSWSSRRINRKEIKNFHPYKLMLPGQDAHVLFSILRDAGQIDAVVSMLNDLVSALVSNRTMYPSRERAASRGANLIVSPHSPSNSLISLFGER